MRSTVSTAAFDSDPVHISAPMACAWASEETAPPPMKMGMPGTAARTELRGPCDLFVMAADCRNDAHRQQSAFLCNGIAHGVRRSVPSELYHVEPAPPQKVGHYRDRQYVKVSRWRGEGDRASVLPTPAELQPKMPDDPLRDRGRPVLFRHGDLPGGPALANGAQGRNHHFGQDAGGIETTAQMALEEPPRARAVAGQHPPLEGMAVGPGSGRSPASGCPQRIHVGRVDPPLRP